MPLESDPIALDEFVLRRIHKNQFIASNPTPVQRNAFEPKPADTKGISVYREAIVTAAQIAAAGAKAGEYYVARLALRDLHALGLSIIADPQAGELPGHCAIPELNWQSFQQNKQRSKELQRELAKVASLEIVHRPS